MPLQVRVHHALGDRLLELPDRAVDNPVIVGRASSCQVQVPSVSVAPRHCALFRHEGHWVVQDVGGTTGTFVNGEQVHQATFLQIGDVISVGNEVDAPTIQVDPAAAAEGRTGYAGDEIGAAYPYGAPQAYPGASGYGAAPVYAPPAPSYPAKRYAPPAQPAWNAPAEETELDALAAWQQADTPAAPSSYRRAGKKKGGNEAGILIGVIAAVVIIGGTAWFLMDRAGNLGQQEVKIVQAPKRGAADDDGPAPKNMFTGGGVGSGGSHASSSPPPAMATPAPVHQAPAAQPTAAPTNNNTIPASPPANPAAVPAATPPASSGAEEGMDPIDPVKPSAPSTPGATPAATPAAVPETVAQGSWEDVQNLNLTSTEPAVAIYRFDDYKRTNPGQHEAEVDQYLEKKFNQIWWERIAGLFKKRDQLNADSAKKQREIWDENNPEEKKKEIADKTKMDKEIKQIGDILHNTMGYDEAQPPNLDDKAQLAELAAKRDGPKYTLWKKLTYKYVRDNHGTLPWSE